MKKLILAFLLLAFSCHARAEEKESSFDRVMRTRTLRCAYTIYPTVIEKDPNTGKMSGLFYDLTEEIGKELDIKIDWVEEVGSDVVFAGMGTRYDANCSGYFATAARAQGGDATKPLVFLPYAVYVRKGETRFHSFEDFNKPDVTIVTLDGELSQVVARENFPNAKLLNQPGLTPATDRFEAVATGKADMTPMETAIGGEYMAANPGKVEQFGTKPLRIGGSVLLLPRNEFALKNMLDMTIDNMLWTGAIARIAAKYTKFPGSILIPSQPYEVPK